MGKSDWHWGNPEAFELTKELEKLQEMLQSATLELLDLGIHPATNSWPTEILQNICSGWILAASIHILEGNIITGIQMFFGYISLVYIHAYINMPVGSCFN